MLARKHLLNRLDCDEKNVRGDAGIVDDRLTVDQPCQVLESVVTPVVIRCRSAASSGVSRSAEPENEPAARFAKRREILVRVAKVLVAIAVAVGLYFAARSAVSQWKSESDKLRLQIAEIDQALQQTDQTGARSELQNSKERLEATVPRLDNLKWGRLGLASLLYAIGLIPPSFLLRRACYRWASSQVWVQRSQPSW